MKLFSILCLVSNFFSKPNIHNSKPIILLEVDGVINMIGSNKKIWNDTKSILIQSSSDLYNVIYSPSMVKSINKWNTIGEVRWLTSWNDYANINLSPSIGLDKFKMGRTIEQYENNEEKLDSATRISKELDKDQLIIWIDDNMNLWKNQDKMIKFYNRPNTLLICPNHGLTPEHVKLVDTYLLDNNFWDKKIIY
jgi:hypothetical protein